jgi:hypothetical protein
MANKDRQGRMQKKPKKDTKTKVVTTHDETAPMMVEVVKRKRKEPQADDD